MLAFLKRMLKEAIGWCGLEVRRRPPPSFPMPPTAFESIPGWFSPAEARLLFLLAYSSPGRILEIGHFLGRSTSAICEGIRLAGTEREFVSYDMGFRSSDEFVAYYSTLYRTTTFPVPPVYEDLVYSKGLTTSEIARRHLDRFGLAQYVTLIAGDFLGSSSKYDLIFADVMHDTTEIARNLEPVIERSADRCTWAFHDMSDENIRTVQGMAPVVLIARADLLAVFSFDRHRPM